MHSMDTFRNGWILERIFSLVWEGRRKILKHHDNVFLLQKRIRDKLYWLLLLPHLFISFLLSACVVWWRKQTCKQIMKHIIIGARLIVSRGNWISNFLWLQVIATWERGTLNHKGCLFFLQAAEIGCLGMGLVVHGCWSKGLCSSLSLPL
jgi:hypothetical protein